MKFCYESSYIDWFQTQSDDDRAVLTRQVVTALAACRPPMVWHTMAAIPFADPVEAETFVTTTRHVALTLGALALILDADGWTDADRVQAALAGGLASFEYRQPWYPASQTKIEWAEATWNPWIGCDIHSAGCKNCYAMGVAASNERKGQTQYAGLTRQVNGKSVWTGKVTLNTASVQAMPSNQKKPTVFFTASMTDVFHESVPDHWLVNLHKTFEQHPRHVFQVLTKRIERAAEWYERRPHYARLPNLWLGCTVENDAAQYRMDILRNIAVHDDQRWLSVEPLIGALDMDRFSLDGMRWVITGGESGGNKKNLPRRCEPEWVRAVRDATLAASVPFFHKQWGRQEWNPLYPNVRALDPWAEGGALLDGRLWREVPRWAA